MGELLILASASPTRKKLLVDAGLEVQIEPAQVDEETIKRVFEADRRAVADCALALAEAKAQQVASNHRDAIIIGADQILVCGKKWFNKPADLADARAQLQALRGRTHSLVTGVCVVQGAVRMWHTIASAKLTMRDFSDAFLDTYLGAERDAVLESVGGYRLEERGIQLFADIKGDYFAILGLPLLELLSFLRSRGVFAS